MSSRPTAADSGKTAAANPTPVAVASRSFSRHPILRAELTARYGNVRFNDEGASLAGEALARFLAGAVKAITALERIDAVLIDRLPDLRVISKYGVGLDMIDLWALHRRGIRLGWTGGTNRRSVAELVLCVAIALLRHVPAANREVLAGAWRQVQGRELSARTVGVVGCGHVGKEVARLLRALGCRVLAHDIRAYPVFYAESGVEPVSLEVLLAEADVVTVHLPLDESTRGLVSASRIAAMKPGAILINMARGGVVDEQALKHALVQGHLGGAGLDVLDREPPDDLSLLVLPNVLATPHIGGSSEEAVLAMGRAAILGLDDNRVPDGSWPLARAVNHGPGAS